MIKLFFTVATLIFASSAFAQNKSSDTLLLESIEINAVRASEKSPLTKTTISGESLQKKNTGQDLPFLINDVPGVVANSDAGNGVGYTGIRIRGTDATRINITLNGIPYNDAESQGTFFVDLPDFASSVSSLQVQRGVGTSSNGAGAFGASINLSTNEVKNDFYAGLETFGGSFNTWKHSFKVGSGLIGRHFTIDARLSTIKSDGYIDRASSDLKSAFVSAAWLEKKSSFRLNVFTGKERTYQSWYGIPERFLDSNRTFNSAGMEQPLKPYENEVDNYNQTHYQAFYNQKISSSLNFQSAFFFTRGKGYYEQYKASAAFADYNLPAVITPNGVEYTTDLVRRLYLDNDFYGTVFSIQQKKNGNEFSFGGGLNRYDAKHYGEIISADKGISENYRWYQLYAYKTDASLYAKGLKKISEHLYAYADAQLRAIVYDIDGFRNNPDLRFHNKFSFFNPKMGLTYLQGNSKAYLSYSQANKEPNRDDFEAGNSQQPLPERLHDIELGYELNKTNYSLSAVGYLMAYKNQLVLTGAINDVGAYTRTNIKDSYRAGVEIEGKVIINKWLTAYSNLCLSMNKIKDFVEYADDYDNGGQLSFTYKKTDIAYSPGVTAIARLTFLPLKNLSADLSSRYVGRQFLDNTSNRSRSLDAFSVQDLRLNYDLKNVAFKNLSVIMQVNNFLDEKYEPNGYTFSYFYGGKLETENFYFPMAGINFMAGVRVGL